MPHRGRRSMYAAPDMRWLPVLAAASTIAAGCGYPDFQFGAGGSGAGTTTTSQATGGGGSGGTGSGAGGTGGHPTSGGCPIDHLIISELRTRGELGATDEFVELFNPTDEAVFLDATWTLDARAASLSSYTYSTRWTGNNRSIPAHGHFLVVGGGYDQLPTSDGKLGSSLTDAASLVLNHAGSPVDALCYYYDPGGLVALTTGLPPFTCAGTPVINPHDDTTGTDVDASVERLPGGAAGNCTDSGDNASDFVTQTPSTPRDGLSPPTPG